MKKYAYYVRSQEAKEVIAFLENKTKTIRDHSTDWDTIGSALGYKIRASIIPDALEIDNLDAVLPFTRSASVEGAGHWLSEHVLNFVIASGYEAPRNLREAKKTLRRHNQSGGYIHPHEY